MAATTASGITTLDGLAGKTVCVGSATTYLDWLEGKLQSVSLGPVATAPAGVKVQTLDTDQACAQAIAAGRKDAEGFLSSSTTVDAAIANGTPVVKVGAPVFTEQLAVSIDKSGPPTTDFIAAVIQIVKDMHADGTLSGFSQKWFKADLTKPPAIASVHGLPDLRRDRSQGRHGAPLRRFRGRDHDQSRPRVGRRGLRRSLWRSKRPSGAIGRGSGSGSSSRGS